MVDTQTLGLNPFLQTLKSPIADIHKDVSATDFARYYQIPEQYITNYNLSNDSRIYKAIVSLSREKGTYNNIQEAVNYVYKNGGGSVLIKAGTYTLAQSITLYNNVSLVGEGLGLVYINFGTAAYNFIVKGSTKYSTGTISVTQGNATVTGSGTSWLTNVTGTYYIIINKKLYGIAAVLADDTLLLEVDYDQGTASGLSYEVAEMITNVSMQNLIVMYSDADPAAIDVEYLYGGGFINVIAIGSKRGIDVEKSFAFTLSNFVADSSTVGAGIDIADSTQFGFVNFTATNNYDGGLKFNNCHDSSVIGGAIRNNDGDGIQVTNSTEITFLSFENDYNNGAGLDIDGTSEEVYYIGAGNDYNTTGVRIDGSASYNVILGSTFSNNTGNGVQIDHSTCGSNIFSDNVFVGNGTAVSDLGVSTRFSDNIGIPDNDYDVGTTSIALTASASTVSFNYLGGTPDAVTITPASSLGSATSYYADTLGTTSFVLHTNTAPGGTTTFYWRVDKQMI